MTDENGRHMFSIVRFVKNFNNNQMQEKYNIYLFQNYL